MMFGDPEEDTALRVKACEDKIRRITGRQTSGRIAGPIVLETTPNADGTWRVQIRNEQTGGLIILGDI